MTKLEELEKYELTQKDINFTVKMLLEEKGYDYTEKEKEEFKTVIKEFLEKFDLYYTDNPDYMIKDHRIRAYRDMYRQYYEITIVPKNNKRKKFRGIIGLPELGSRYFDLLYIIETLQFYAMNGEDIDIDGDMTEKEMKEQDETSTRLWNLLDVLENKESFWVDILEGSF